MKKLIIVLLLFMTTNCFANPAPFGLEIGKATITDIKAKFEVKSNGINKYTGGEMYDLIGVKFDGLISSTALFNQEGRLVALLNVFQKDKFDYLLNNLSKKYRLVTKKIPFVRNKSAKLINGDTQIMLDAPHMSFEMQLNYINNEEWKAYQAQLRKEQRQKQKSEQSQL